MANSTSVTLKLLADTRDATKNIEGFTSGLEKTFRRVGIAAGAAFAFLAGREIVQAISGVVAAAQEQENAINDLNSALLISGRYTAEVSKELVEYATSLQQATTFGDEAIISASSLIQTLGQLDKEGLKKATKASLDLAAALNIDLNSAAQLVGKAAAGNVEAFTRYGVVVQKGTTDAESFANALNAINQKFGGRAEAQVNTYSGAVAQASNNFSDIGETIGGFITQNAAVINTIKAASSLFVQLNETIAEHGELFSTIVTGAMKAFIFSVSAVIEVIRLMDMAFTGVKNTVMGFVDLLIQIPKRIKTLANNVFDFQGISKLNDELGTKFEGRFKGLEERVAFYDKLGKSVADFNVKLSQAAATTQLISRNTASAAKPIPENIQRLMTELQNVGLSQLEIIKKERDTRIKAIEDAFRAQTLSAKDRASILAKIELDFAEKTAKEKKKIDEELHKNQLQLLKEQADARKARSDRNKSLSQDPFSFDSNLSGGKLFSKPEDALALMTGAVNLLVKGVQGATTAVSRGMGLIADSFIPGIGGAVSEIVGVLAQGPDKVNEMVTGFIRAIPDIVVNIVNSIPVLINTLIEELPILIERLAVGLAEAMPTVAAKLAAQAPFIGLRIATGIISHLPMIMKEFSKEMLKIPGEFVRELLKELGNSIPGGKALGGIAGPLGDIVGDVGKGGFIGGAIAGPVGGAVGGAIGAIGDVFGFRSANPDALEIAGRRSGSQGSGSGEGSNLEQKITALQSAIEKSSEKNLSVKLVVGERELAGTILNLNRQGFRLA